MDGDPTRAAPSCLNESNSLLLLQPVAPPPGLRRSPDWPRLGSIHLNLFSLVGRGSGFLVVTCSARRRLFDRSVHHHPGVQSVTAVRCSTPDGASSLPEEPAGCLIDSSSFG
ncbi:hypothetical protein EYF80_061880 [Liparis tanakae]|uniref:Uncharacterized protein n=1 Tax=Liparis tanakae TaxID=230148 RepID=A0A4Z2EHY7_9TELE|nr:hypothetical protein EYF80_061880 [Liparis tanakae]